MASDDHAPVKSFRRKHGNQFQFINPELREVMRKHNHFNKSRKPEDWEKYRQLRNRAVSMRRKSVRDHFSRICNDKHSDQKKFWNTIRPYISSRKKQSFYNERIVLKDNGGVIREQKKVAEVLAEYFSSSQHPDFNQLPTNSYQTIKAHQSRPLTLTNRSPGEVKRIMKNRKANKATGHDQIPARAIKESAEILCQPFSCLVNFLFERGKVSSSWKLGEIVLVHKKDCTLTKTNYRPITILPVLSKVVEKLVH